MPRGSWLRVAVCLLIMTGNNRDAGKAATAIRAEQQAGGVAIPFDVVSNPEFIKDGLAVADFQKPDRIVVMDLRFAELSKVAANAMLATKISFMNELANLAERVRIGIGSDPRMGSVEAVNQFQKQRPHRLISQHFGGGGGLAARRFAVWIYPKALADGRLSIAATKEEATEGADALVICTEWKRFMAPNFDQLGCALSQKLIFDGRNLYDLERLAELGWTYDAIGRGASVQAVV